MSEFLAQLTDPLTKSISTILRQRNRGNIGNAEWGEGENGGIMRMHVSCQKYFTDKKA